MEYNHTKFKWKTKASASQRAGRVGRTAPGHCYCLYTSAALSNQFPDFSTPEILKMPADNVVLLLKSIGFPEVANFPFPTPPDAEALKNAERRLKILGALDCECSRIHLWARQWLNIQQAHSIQNCFFML